MANKKNLKSKNYKKKRCSAKLTENQLEKIAGGKIRYPEEREVN